MENSNTVKAFRRISGSFLCAISLGWTSIGGFKFRSSKMGGGVGDLASDMGEALRDGVNSFGVVFLAKHFERSLLKSTTVPRGLHKLRS